MVRDIRDYNINDGFAKYCSKMTGFSLCVPLRAAEKVRTEHSP